MVPELHPPSPAKKFFTKMAKSFFGKKKAKGKQDYYKLVSSLTFHLLNEFLLGEFHLDLSSALSYSNGL